MAPPSKSLAEDLQILRISSPSPAWTSLLPKNTAPAATFYLFSTSPSPWSSEGEGQAQAHDQNRIKPPQANVDAAAYYMCQLLKAVIHNGQFALAGGFAMRVHGSRRQTFDVDIYVKPEPGKPPPLRSMLQSSRIILPSSKFIGAVLRCYVKTGPSFCDNIQFDRAVKVDLMLDEFLPPRFTDHTLELSDNAQDVRVLDRQCSLKCKLSAYSNRATANDYSDIKDLIFRFPDEIRGYRHRLDQEYVEYFIEQGLMIAESQATVQQAKRILMLTGPPSPSSA